MSYFMHESQGSMGGIYQPVPNVPVQCYARFKVHAKHETEVACSNENVVISPYFYQHNYTSFMCKSFCVREFGQVCARKRKTFVLTDEGSVFAFGWMGFGSLGFPDRGSSDKVMQPRVLNSLSGYYVSQISTGLYHTVAVTNKGIVFGFGDNERAQLGQEFIRGCLKPTEIMFDKSSIEDIAIAAPSG